MTTLTQDELDLIDRLPDAVLALDANRLVVACNRAARKLLAGDAMGLALAAIAPNAEAFSEIWTAEAGGGHFEAHAIGRDGRAFPAAFAVGPASPGFLVTLRDLTDQTAIERQLVERTLRDTLTGLPARALFLEQVEQALARRRLRGGAHEIAVVCLDVDRFKVVNDSLGYRAGDELLAAVAGRLEDALGTACALARLGGDEFGFLVECPRKTDAALAVERALAAFSPGFALSGALPGRQLTVSASAGLAFADSETEMRAQSLVSNADVALSRAKSSGGGRIEIFEPGRHGEALGLLEMELHLREALDKAEFDIVYQPIVDLESGRMRGVEALLRWNRDGQTPVPPAVFIPVAEQSGLIVPIGRFVLERACAQMAAWRRTHGNAAPDFVSVNLSARQLARDDVPALVCRALARAGLDAAHLELELTESVVLENPEAARRFLDEVVKLGASLAIDDFGTGQSSLSLLPSLPFAKLKIDRSFVSDMDVDPNSFEIVRVIVGLAKALGLRAVAEGVERASQSKLLREMGCFFGQGYHYHRPLPAREIDRLCAQFPSEPAAPSVPRAVVA
ncbi:MAG: EAL domain-containing protein [Tagaea sp.]|nr:EAL domain-containing protein [Tagaea sp.]